MNTLRQGHTLILPFLRRGLLALALSVMPWGFSHAQVAPLDVQISIDRSTYIFEDLPPLGLTQDPIQIQMVINNPGLSVLSDQDFVATGGEEPFELQLLVRDPQGQLITATDLQPEGEPLPSRGFPVNGQLIAVAAVESIGSGVVLDLLIPDIRQLYALTGPGQYTVQAHIPFRNFTTVFVTDPNNQDFSKLTDIDFVGALRSNVVPFALVTDADADTYAFPVSDPRVPTFSVADCDDSNPNVNPGQSEILGDGLDNDCDATTTDGGVLFNPFTVTKAKVKQKSKPNKDKFHVEGTWGVGGASNGIDPVLEAVTVTFGNFLEVIPPGSFEREDDEWEYEPEGEGTGITKLEIKDDGTFKVKAKKLDLSGLNITLPVSFLLRVGDDVGEVEIPFDAKGKF